MKSEEVKVKSEVRDSLRVEQVFVAERDTVTIRKTITIRENERGDTIRMNTVTDRERTRSMYDVRRQKEEVRVYRDTVYIERRDSVQVKSEEIKVKSDRASGFVSALKWIFGIIVAVIALTITKTIKNLRI